MSCLENLPDEIVFLIIKKLDVISLYNIYTACDRVRDIICTYGVIKTCDLSLSVMAKADTFKLPFFKHLSRKLQELNVCGMCDLYKTVFIPVVKRMQCLNTLDVTYTKISITDLLQIYKVCPTIKDISINFSFGKSVTKLHEVRLYLDNLYLYQELFKNFSNVHFVGNLHIMMYSQLPNLILKSSKLKNLKYTINDCNPSHNPMETTGILQFENFTLYFLNAKIQMSASCMSHHFANQHGDFQNYGYLDQMCPFDLFDFKDYESIIIIRKHCLTKPICYVSPIFENFFRKYANSHLVDNIDLNITNNFNIDLIGNVCIMLWNKSVTTFDDKFFLNLWCKLKPFFPCYFDSSPETIVTSDYYLYVTIPQDNERKPESPQVGFKRKRLVAPSCVLNYDTAFQTKNNVRLTLLFENNIKCAVTLPTTSQYLKKLTYLSLSGHIRYNVEFFNILFRSCEKLITLSVKANSCCSCYASITQSITLSHSIKNFQLIDRSIDFPELFAQMCLCETLENVHILDIDTKNFSDPSVVFNTCKKLYCMYLYVYSSCSGKKKIMQIMKHSKIPRQRQTVLKILMNNYLLNDPYSDVFKLNLL